MTLTDVVSGEESDFELKEREEWKSKKRSSEARATKERRKRNEHQDQKFSVL